MAILGVGDGLAALYGELANRADRYVAGVHAYFLQNRDSVEPIVAAVEWSALLLHYAEALELLPEGLDGLDTFTEVLDAAATTIRVMVEDPIANDNVLSTVIGGPDVNVAPPEPNAPAPAPAPAPARDHTDLTASTELVGQPHGVDISGTAVNSPLPESLIPSNDNVNNGLAGVLEMAERFEAAYWERHTDDSEQAKETARAQFEQARAETTRQWEARQLAERERELRD